MYPQHITVYFYKHVLQVMPANDKKLLCGQCNRVYETQSSLDQHIEASHQPPRGQGSKAVSPPPTQIPCGECKRQFSTTAALEQHMQQSHIKANVHCHLIDKKVTAFFYFIFSGCHRLPRA